MTEPVMLWLPAWDDDDEPALSLMIKAIIELGISGAGFSLTAIGEGQPFGEALVDAHWSARKDPTGFRIGLGDFLAALAAGERAEDSHLFRDDLAVGVFDSSFAYIIAAAETIDELAERIEGAETAEPPAVLLGSGD